MFFVGSKSWFQLKKLVLSLSHRLSKCPEYDIKTTSDGEVLVLEFREYEVFFHYHYS